MLATTAVHHQPTLDDFIPAEPTPEPNVVHLVMFVNPKTGDKGGFTVRTFTEAFWEVVEAYRAKLKTLPQYKGWLYHSSDLLTPITDDEF